MNGSNVDFTREIDRIRRNAIEIATVLRDEPGSPWYPDQDPEFWATLDKIEAVGCAPDEEKCRWLAELIVIDDLGPLGRGLILSTAALAALRQMPSATRVILDEFEDLNICAMSKHAKIGVLKIWEAGHTSGFPLIIAKLASDSDERISRRVADMLERRSGT